MSFTLLFVIWLLLLVGSYLGIDNLYLKKDQQTREKKREKLLNYLLVIGFILLLLIFFVTMSKQMFVQNIIDSIMSVCVLALATTGIVLIFKTSNTTNFAQGMMATFGAFVAGKLLISLNTFKGLSQVELVGIAMIAGAVTSFIIGLLIDVIIIRNAKKVTAVGKQMITMGLVLVLSGLMPVIFGVIPIAVRNFNDNPINFKIGNLALTIPTQSIYAFVITVSVLSILFVALKFTKWGLGVRATSSNEVVAGMMGVNTRVITAFSWAIAGLLGGIAAVLYAPNGGQVTVGLMISTQVNGFLASILGGFTSFGGPIIGSILIPFLSKMFTYYNSLWQGVIVYVIILLIVLVKPLGLFGKKIAKKV